MRAIHGNKRGSLAVLLLRLLPLAIFAFQLSPAEARKSKRKQTEPIELSTPERMLGYSEIMRLKPEARARYRRKIADMMAEVSLIPSSRRFRLIVDDTRMTPAEQFYSYTWTALLLPPAQAADASAPEPPKRPSANSLKCGAADPIKVNNKVVDTKQCSVGSNDALSCPSGYLPVSDKGGNGTIKCVSESGYRQAMGERASEDWSKAQQECAKKQSADSGAGGKSGKGEDTKNSPGKPCIYAGWINKTDESGKCPRPENHVEIKTMDDKQISVKCESPKQLLCNPAVFGVVKQDNAGFVGVCVEPSVHATMNCRALSVAKGTLDNEKDPKSDISNPEETTPKDGPEGDKFQNRRANVKATESLFNTAGFADFYNEHVDKQADFCSTSGSNKDNMLHFCEECQSIVQKMNRANAEITAAGASGPTTPAAQ